MTGNAAGVGGKIGRLWRTIRWLKPSQIVGRVRHRLYKPRPELHAAPGVRPGAWQWVAPCSRQVGLVGPTRMRFLAVEHDLAQVGWDDPAVPLLWRYNQHYFDDLNAKGAEARRAWHRDLIGRWLAAAPAGVGTAWAPYPTSLRIVNWVKWFLGGAEPEAAWLHSLAVQARWLTQRLEWHLLGNHLFVNAKALVFAGLYFQGQEADAWLAEGVRILRRELSEQILSDGAQFERTPMYHALALEDVLDLLNVIRSLAPGDSTAPVLVLALRAQGSAMLHWLRSMTHPNGTLSRFNDCAEGISAATPDLERYAQAMGVTAAPVDGDGVSMLQPSGYIRAARGPAVAILDVAPLGPDYLPGHAHADTLSFELSVGGREVVVNRGTSVYGEGPRRQVERSTAAHSTVQIGDCDSSEVWAGFRVGRRARPIDVRIDGWAICAAHDGYAHLSGRPIHHRRWRLDDGALTVMDWLAPHPTGSGAVAVARYHLAPGLALERKGPRVWQVLDNGAVVAVASIEVGVAQIEPWQHAVRFGELADAETLVVRLEDSRATLRWKWGPLCTSSS